MARKAPRGPAIFVTLLPTIVMPVVSAPSIHWLFLDGAVVTAFPGWLGLGRLCVPADQGTIGALIIGSGIWFAAPFAFIIFHAGLQTVPQDRPEAAIVDGADAWQRLRHVILPHLAPLVAIITLIHVMDAHRVLEPILVFGSAVHADPVQSLTHHALVFEDRADKAAAQAIPTVIGVVLIPTPMRVRRRRAHRTAFLELGRRSRCETPIVVLVAIDQPFTIRMLRTFFPSIPPALDAAAMVDGRSRWGAFRRVIVPVMWPGIVTAGLLSFLPAHNDVLNSSRLMNGEMAT